MAIKVLRIINRLVIGGPTYNVSYLTKHMEPEFETILLSGEKEDDEEYSDFIPKQMGIEPRYIKSMQKSLSKPWRDRKAYREIRDIIDEFKPDVVHTHAAKAGFIGRLAAINAKVPVVLHTFHGHYFHSYFHPLKTKTLLQIERYLAGKTDGIIAISPEQYIDLADVYKVAAREKVFQVPLGFDLDRFMIDQDEKRKQFRAEFNLQEDEVAIGIVGRIVPIKNHSLFNRMIPAIMSAFPGKVKFFYIGDGDLRAQTEEELRQLGVAFTGEQEKDFSKPAIFTSWRKDMEHVYAGLDIIALTSLNEGTPVSIIEAQAATKAIVSTDVGGLRYVAEDEKTAFLVPSNDLDALTNRMLQLVGDAELRKQMGQAGRAFVLSKFSVQRLVQDMSDLYTRLLREKGYQL
jgi:glycosyltransferase involved in cell wall biosynthesis